MKETDYNYPAAPFLMTAVANPPSFEQLNNRSAWNVNGSAPNIDSMNSDDVRGMFMPRKPMQRSNSSSSISSTGSASSATTVATNGSQSNGNGTPASTNSDTSTWSAGGPRKRPQPKAIWPTNGKPLGGLQAEILKSPAGAGAGAGRPPPNAMGTMNGINGGSPQSAQGQQPQMAPQQQQQPMGARPIGEAMAPAQPVLYLLSLNGTFERKTISVPFYPDSLRIGRQTNQKTIPTPANGFFDSKVLSRQHAEIWADRMGKIFIRDVKSSNGTFVNGTRLSQENRESEPHELQTADHLELGIDIVSEDQKTVVHHKVAAKVEHAGFITPSSNVLDMNFGDLDPANGGSMLAPPQGGVPLRGRQGSNASMVGNGRGMPPTQLANPQMNPVQGRGPFMLSSVTSDHIIKRLQNEMRSAKLQSQDLGRTGQFITTLLSKDDVKELEKPEAPEPPKQITNGNSLPLRADPKARFSDPPAPPPQQPLPEKPDVPALKRGTTERPKSHPSNGSPVRQDNVSQIIQLTEALNNAKKEIDTQTQRMRDLEDMLERERGAREVAEDLAKRLEDTSISKELNGLPKTNGPDPLQEAFEPPREAEPADTEMPDADASVQQPTETETKTEAVEAVSAQFQAKVDSMVSEVQDLRQQMEAWRQRCEKAEAERDSDRKTLAEMVLKIRKDEEAREAAAKEKSRSRSRRRGRSRDPGATEDASAVAPAAKTERAAGPKDEKPAASAEEDLTDKPTLSRANTITPMTATSGTLAVQEHALMAGIPYASMVGVVLIGVGLMAYINGLAPTPRTSQ